MIEIEAHVGESVYEAFKRAFKLHMNETPYNLWKARRAMANGETFEIISKSVMLRFNASYITLRDINEE